MNFTHAIVRTPGETFAQGITTSGLGAPDLKLALEQHAAYARALESCGLQVTVLQPEPEFPDSTFVEDPAVLAGGAAILARPGAESRAGEVERIRPVLEARFEHRERIQPPGTLDGGDICQAGKHFFIGISDRTNEEGARQLAGILAGLGFSSAPVDLRAVPGLLHLKSGLAALDEHRLLIDERLAGLPAFAGYELLHVPPEESYAANCLPINGWVLFAAGFPRQEARLRQAGCNLLVLDVSEFRKMEGGLSCLSLRW